MRPEDFFGTLQDSITAEWRKHLQADNHDIHVILDEFYKEMPELVDALIEAWQADHDVVKDYNNMLDAKEVSALAFLEELKNFTKRGRSELLAGESELESLCDDILAQIDSTIYKLKRLTKEGQQNESKKIRSLVDFIKETLNESFDAKHFCYDTGVDIADYLENIDDDKVYDSMYEILDNIARKLSVYKDTKMKDFLSALNNFAKEVKNKDYDKI